MNDQWYQNRDTRTDNCNGVNTSYKNATVSILVYENTEEYRIQLLIYFTLKILVKWCRNIRLTLPDTSCLLSKKQESLGSFLRSEVLAVDPYCSLTIHKEDTQEASSIHLLIGKSPVEVTFDFVSANAVGWVATCAFNQHAEVASKAAVDSFVGPAFAACLANAELFRYLIGEKPYSYTKWYSLWTNEVFDTAPVGEAFGMEFSPTDFGRIHLIGCGAIGSSFAFLFPYSKCIAQFLLVDPDEVEDHNTSSSLLFNFNHAATHQAKVELCVNYLKDAGIYAEPFRDDYNKFEYDHASEGLRAADIILCFANENDIWSTIQYLYPPLCFHATTSKSWGIHIGRHIPLVDNCIMCTFEGLIKVNDTLICAAAEIATVVEDGHEERHTAILPFLAPAAALVAFCELFKTATGTEKNENTVIFNMQSSEGIFVSQEGKFGGCYICKTQTELLYKQFCEKTKFWKPSSV
jgi:hypothetical protein